MLQTDTREDRLAFWAERPDSELLEAIRAGDTSLYEILAHRYSPLVRRAARRIVRNEDDAEELVQEAHLNALAHLDQFAGRSSFCTWLTRIAVYGAFSRLRRHPRPQDLTPVSAHADEDGVVPVATGRDPEQQLLNSELSQLLQHAIASLPDRYRSVFVLREIDEKTTSEAAHSLCTSEQCVKTRLHRSKALLRKKLRSQWYRKACHAHRETRSIN